MPGSHVSILWSYSDRHGTVSVFLGNDISSFNIVNDIVVNLAVNMSTQIEAMF